MRAIDKGKVGEKKAARYLKRKGYRILERNYRAGKHEIDLIAYDKREDCLVFVEVKARSESQFGLPGEAVNANKQRFLRLAALSYLKQIKGEESPARFDVIEVYFDKGDIRHIINAF